MNTFVKFALATVAVRAVTNGATRLFEVALAKADPIKHEAYVDLISEIAGTRIDAFIKRNADLADALNPERTAEEQAAYDQAKQTVTDIFTKIQKAAKEGNL